MAPDDPHRLEQSEGAAVGDPARRRRDRELETLGLAKDKKSGVNGGPRWSFSMKVAFPWYPRSSTAGHRAGKRPRPAPA
jgi:hypothetical protein